MLKRELGKTNMPVDKDQEAADHTLLADLDSHLQQGLDDLKNGRVMSLEEAFHRLHEELGLKRA